MQSFSLLFALFFFFFSKNNKWIRVPLRLEPPSLSANISQIFLGSRLLFSVVLFLTDVVERLSVRVDTSVSDVLSSFFYQWPAHHRGSAAARAPLSVGRQQSAFAPCQQINSSQTIITFHTQVFLEAIDASSKDIRHHEL